MARRGGRKGEKLRKNNNKDEEEGVPVGVTGIGGKVVRDGWVGRIGRYGVKVTEKEGRQKVV